MQCAVAQAIPLSCPLGDESAQLFEVRERRGAMRVPPCVDDAGDFGTEVDHGQSAPGSRMPRC